MGKERNDEQKVVSYSGGWYTAVAKTPAFRPSFLAPPHLFGPHPLTVLNGLQALVVGGEEGRILNGRGRRRGRRIVWLVLGGVHEGGGSVTFDIREGLIERRSFLTVPLSDLLSTELGSRRTHLLAVAVPIVLSFLLRLGELR